MKKKKTTTIIVTRDECDGEGIAWKLSSRPEKYYGDFLCATDPLFRMGCVGNYVFKALFPSRPRKGRKKKYRVTVEEL